MYNSPLWNDYSVANSKLSNDGLPLASTLNDLLFFPSTRVNMNTPFAYWLPTAVPIFFVCIYLVGEPLLYQKYVAGGKTSMSAPFKLVVLLHNVLLAVYSGITSYCTISLFLQSYKERGIVDTYIDFDGKLWNSGFGFWATLFFVSKIWEFFDTIVLVVRGIKPLTLQVYHHAGVVLCMWMMVVSQETSGLLTITILNSTVHTIMYTYYSLATIDIKVPFKSMITQIQMLQFIVGISFTTPKHFFERTTMAQHFGLICTQVYTVYLTTLFLTFYKNSYLEKKKSKGETEAGVKAIKTA